MWKHTVCWQIFTTLIRKNPESPCCLYGKLARLPRLHTWSRAGRAVRNCRFHTNTNKYIQECECLKLFQYISYCIYILSIIISLYLCISINSLYKMDLHGLAWISNIYKHLAIECNWKALNMLYKMVMYNNVSTSMIFNDIQWSSMVIKVPSIPHMSLLRFPPSQMMPSLAELIRLGARCTHKLSLCDMGWLVTNCHNKY